MPTTARLRPTAVLGRHSYGVEMPTHRPKLPGLANVSNFITSHAASPPKSPARTFIVPQVSHSPQSCVRKREPSDRPTHRPLRPSEPSGSTSNFITSQRPSSSKSPASSLVCPLVTQSAHLVVTNELPVEMPTHRPF